MTTEWLPLLIVVVLFAPVLVYAALLGHSRRQTQRLEDRASELRQAICRLHGEIRG